MSDNQHIPTSEREEPRKLKGLYKGINVSVKSLNVIIITFDSSGGTVVASQTQMSGELLKLPDPPTREGYAFTGWYKDYACYEPWNTEVDTIQSEMTLYAGWEKIT